MKDVMSSPQASFPPTLLQSPDLYRNLFDQVSDYVLVFNHDLRAIYTNNTCLNFLKTPVSTREYLLGKDFVQFAPDYREIEGWNRFMNSSVMDDTYSMDCYDAISPLYRRPLWVKVHLQRSNDLLCAIVTETTEQVIKNDNLKKQLFRIAELETYSTKLKNTIEILLVQARDKQNEIGNNSLKHIEETIFPIIDMLKSTHLDENQLSILDLLSSTLNTSIAPFLEKINSSDEALTSREIHIANLIRLGKATKEIARLLCLSTKTVDYHRANIRKKLKIDHTSDDLGDYLRNL